MTHFGEFGTDPEAVVDLAEPDTFDFYGQRCELPARLSQLPLTKFAWDIRRLDRAEKDAKDRLARAVTGSDAEAAAKDDLSGVELDQLAAVYDFLRSMLPGPQWERFEQVTQAYGVELDELFDVAMKIYGAVADRPTRRPSGLSGGPLTDVTSSPAGSSSRGAPEAPGNASDRERQMAEFVGAMRAPQEALAAGGR